MPITQLSAISITDETVYRIGQLLTKLIKSRKFQNMMYVQGKTNQVSG